MNIGSPSIFVVDEDESARRRLHRILTSVGYTVETFESAEALLSCDRPDGPCCLVLEARLTGADGLEVQRQLAAENREMPIVFLTADGDIRTAVRALKAGAIDFLTKPIDVEKLLEAVDHAIRADHDVRTRNAERRAVRERVKRLTRREYEVIELVATGMLNKQIAYDLGTSEKTIKVHRARGMAKAEVSSVADLVRFVDRAHAAL